MLNLHLVRIFVAVAEARNFSRAAEQLYISQPAVSKGIQELEQQLGMSLFNRVGRSIQLTEAGEVLYANARIIFASERAAETALEQMRGLQRGHLAVGASATIGSYMLPSLLGAFNRLYPGINLFLDIGNTPQIADRLLHARLDTAFVEGAVDPARFQLSHWRDDRLVVIADIHHPLGAQQSISLDQLRDVTVIMREPESGTRLIVQNVLRAKGIEIMPGLELSSNEAIKQAVMAGLGLAIVSTETIRLELETNRLLILDVPDLTIVRPLVRLEVEGRPPSPALRAFQSYVNGEAT